MEQKLKQVTDEMNCQRHNAESCRRALEQKLKDKERDSQKVQQQPVVTIYDVDSDILVDKCVLRKFDKVIAPVILCVGADSAAEFSPGPGAAAGPDQNQTDTRAPTVQERV